MVEPQRSVRLDPKMWIYLGKPAVSWFEHRCSFGSMAARRG